MHGDLKLVNINDERFWDILFEEACVEGQQATRIRNELEKIIAYDVEKVVAELEELSLSYELNCHKMIRENKCHESEDCGICAFKQAIEIVRNGGKE